MESREHDGERKEVSAVIFAFFEAGKNKDLGALGGFHSSHDSFTKFDENPPYTRQNSQEAFVYEQAAFANISDYEYHIDDLRIDMLGSVAIATFYLAYKGMFVNDYSFEGTPVSSRALVTMVLFRSGGAWRIAHEHLSSFPDWRSNTGNRRGSDHDLGFTNHRVPTATREQRKRIAPGPCRDRRRPVWKHHPSCVGMRSAVP